MHLRSDLHHLWNPKPTAANGANGQSWYRYYASFSEAFVADLIAGLKIAPNAVVLDPWNGTGTTTRVATRAGASGIGYEINPALIVIARGRGMPASRVREFRRLVDFVCSDVGPSATPPSTIDDSLATWFTNRTVESIRRLESTVRATFGTEQPSQPVPVRPTDLDQLTAAAYVALFKTIRRNMTQLTGSNPTWLRRAHPTSEKCSLSSNRLLRDFKVSSDEVASYALTFNHSALNNDAQEILTLGDSRHLELFDNTVDLVLTSPPYCTRIDYVISTLPELALLGFANTSYVRSLRTRTIGSPLTTARPDLPTNSVLGKYCSKILSSIATHSSKASKTYYLSFFTQYFIALNKSIEEIARVLKPGGCATFVVQDSYYKDIHVDLAGIVIDFARYYSLTLESKVDYSVRASFSRLNSRTWRYGGSKRTSVESAILLRKKTIPL